MIEANGEYIKKTIGDNVIPQYKPVKKLQISVSDNQITDSNSVSVSVRLVDNLSRLRGTDNIITTNSDVIIRIDGSETTKTLTDGSVSWELTTDKPAGSEIEVEAVGLADHPAESDRTTIEVVQ